MSSVQEDGDLLPLWQSQRVWGQLLGQLLQEQWLCHLSLGLWPPDSSAQPGTLTLSSRGMTKGK